MGNSVTEMNVSEVRTKLPQLDKILNPGESLEIKERGKPYARIELIGTIDDGYDKILNMIEALQEPKDELMPVAENYKSIFYGRKDADVKRF